MSKLSPLPPVDRRAMRARHLAAAMLRELDDFIPRDSRSGAHDALMKLFMDSDAEVITSADRITAGLPERNSFGLTPDEHRAIEAQRMLMLVSSPTPILFCSECPHKPVGNRPPEVRDGD